MLVGQQQQHRRRKHSQIDIAAVNGPLHPDRRDSITAEAKRQCVENAAAQAQDMPASSGAGSLPIGAATNDGESNKYAQEGEGSATVLRIRGGGPTASEAGAAPNTRRTRAAAAAATATSATPPGASASTSKARPPPPRPQSTRASSAGRGTSSSDNEERSPLLGTPRVPVPPSALLNQPQQQALAPMPPAPRRPASRPTGAGVTWAAAAASGSASSGNVNNDATGGMGVAPPLQQEQQTPVPVPAPAGGPGQPDPNANAQPSNDNDNSGGGGGGGSDGGNNNEERPPTVAILNIRSPFLPPQPQKSSQQPQRPGQQLQQHPNAMITRPGSRDGPIVKVLVPTSGDNAMTERQLGRCIVQATGIGIAPPTADGGGWGWHLGLGYDPYVQYGRVGGANDNDGGKAEPPLAGLFRRDGLFLPLSYVLANALSLQGELLSITRPVPRPKPPPPQPPTWPYVAGGLFVASIMARYGIDWGWFFDVTFFYVEIAAKLLIGLPFQLFQMLIEIPLKETYRHGPSFIGWEGQPLPRICAHVTFHGDEAFWSRNMQECEKIYAAKEAAALHIRKPILYIAIATGLFFAIQSLVRTHAIRRQYRPDRNMVDTYNALNILLRQFNKAGGAMGMRR